MVRDVNGVEQRVGRIVGTATATSRIGGEEGDEREGRGKKRRKVWHLGMFAVDPTVQGLGLGKKVLEAVEEFATVQGEGDTMEVSVELEAIREMGNIDYYQARGYELVFERWVDPGAWGCEKGFNLGGLEKVVRKGE